MSLNIDFGEWVVALAVVFALFRLASALDHLRSTLKAMKEELQVLEAIRRSFDESMEEQDEIEVRTKDPTIFKFFGKPKE